MSKKPITFIKEIILAIIDFFYPPFRKLIPVQTFRYLACGGGVTVLGLFIFFVSHHFLLTPFLHTEVVSGKTEEWISLGPVSMTRYIAAYAVSLVISFPIGFFLSKFVVFQESQLKGRIQLFRYASLQILNIIFNYFLLHFFAGYCGFWATPSQTLTAVILATFSYFFQRYISFRAPRETSLIENNDIKDRVKR